MNESKRVRGPHPYDGILARVEKPARYTGGEFGAVCKDWDSVEARVCLAFPDLYDIGMSHLGFKILYKILNDDPRTLAERAYAPWVDMENELRAGKIPLVSLESARPLSDFDVVGFSLQFELTYTNILLMLDLGGVPLRSTDRDEDAPLVIAGGPTATHPEPLCDVIDAFVIGDGEQRTTDISLAWTRLKAQGLSRRERLVELAKLGGVYVPSLYATTIEEQTGHQVVTKALEPGLPLPIERTLVPDLNDYPFPHDGPVGGPEAIFDRMSIEIARGCTEGCRFCQAGMIYRPVRERDPQQIVDTLVKAVKESGYDEVSLTSLSTADYSCIAPLVKKVTDTLAAERVSLGVSSLRAYGLEENVLDDMQSVRASGITFAPEAGSQRMRDVVNKNVTEEQLMTTAERVFSRGWTSMKLYFMIGLPTEEESDIREIVGVGKRARDVGRTVKKAKGEGPPTITVSVSTHVPKPHTPFQWCAMDALADVKRKQSYLRDEASDAKNVKLRMHDSKASWLEGVFARGDRSLCKVLLRAYENGARFDSWNERLKLEVWEQAFIDEGVEPATFLGTIPVTAGLPWDHISVGLEEGFLVREYRKALGSRLSPPCGKVAGAFVHHTNLVDAHADQKKLVCYDCGVACDLSAMRKERLVYLRKLDAEEPRPRPLEPKAPLRDRGFKRAPAMLVQGAPRRYRFAYTKAGPTAYLSHLDLIRALPRSFRRIGAPLFYSSGFHPKPDMIFGPALSLGVASLAECVDMKISADIDVSTIVAELNQASPEGLVFTAAERLAPGQVALSKIIDASRYLVCIPEAALPELGGLAALLRIVNEFNARDEARVMRRIENVGKWVDVRKMTTHLDVARVPDADLSRAGIVGTYAGLSATVVQSNSGSVKISEVMQVLSETLGLEIPWRAIRMEMGALRDGRIVSPIDVLREEAQNMARAIANDAAANEAAASEVNTSPLAN